MPQGTGSLALIHVNHPKVLSGETTVILLAFWLWSQMFKTQMQWNTFLFYVNSWDNPTYYMGGHSNGAGKSNHCSHVRNTTRATFDCPMPQTPDIGQNNIYGYFAFISVTHASQSCVVLMHFMHHSQCPGNASKAKSCCKTCRRGWLQSKFSSG